MGFGGLRPPKPTKTQSIFCLLNYETGHLVTVQLYHLVEHQQDQIAIFSRSNHLNVEGDAEIS